MNRVSIIGNLTRDPELQYTGNGNAICKFGVAINEKTKIHGEWKTKPIFVDITAWGKQAESCSEYLNKGDKAAIDGRLSFSSWEADDGSYRSKLEVTADKIDFLHSPKSKTSQDTEDSDDVPF